LVSTAHPWPPLSFRLSFGLQSAGTKDVDTTFGGVNALYGFGPYFIAGGFQYEAGDADFRNFALASQGSFDTEGNSWQLAMGRSFLLAASGAADVMAPYALFLDLRVEGGRSENDSGNFIDSAGNTFGKQEQDYSNYGTQARLHALVASHGILWQPFVGVGVDRIIDDKHTLVLPAQGAFVGAIVNVDSGETTQWNFDGGLDATLGRFTLGAKGLYGTNGPDDDYGGGLSLAVAIGGE